jgi:hypothetical protein
MTLHTDIRRPHVMLTERDIARNVAALGYPEGWTAADDLAMMEGLFRGLSLSRIAEGQGKPLDAVQARFIALRDAATEGDPRFVLTAQERLLAVVRGRV